MNFRFFILLSTLIHLFLFSLFIRKIDQQEEDRQNKKALNKEVIEFIIPDENNKVEEKGDFYTKKEEKKDDCNDFYIGIGIQINIVYIDDTWWLLVTKVYSGYTAEKYGILVGDLIFEKEIIRDGFAGEPVNLIIKRDNKVFEISIPRTKVCVQ